MPRDRKRGRLAHLKCWGTRQVTPPADGWMSNRSRPNVRNAVRIQCVEAISTSESSQTFEGEIAASALIRRGCAQWSLPNRRFHAATATSGGQPGNCGGPLAWHSGQRTTYARGFVGSSTTSGVACAQNGHGRTSGRARGSSTDAITVVRGGISASGSQTQLRYRA